MEAKNNHLREHGDGSDHHQLPDDMLANVLGRLPPSSLAASRCVRKHWCSLIDARRLLRADLLPLRLDAFFVNPTDMECRPSFFAPHSAMRRITGHLLDFSDFFEGAEFPYMDIRGHCNGMLLLADMVVNPATRQWTSLPEYPEGLPMTMASMTGLMSPECYLVYDPMVSPQHYEVFIIPSFRLCYSRPPDIISDDDDGDEIKPTSLEEEMLSAEWPPSPYTAHVFSSRKRRWEERSFVRQGEPAGTVADVMRSDRGRRQGVYFRRALYVHCQDDSVIRIALSDDRYEVIKSPAAEAKHFGKDPPFSYLGKSEKGVYFVLLHQWYDSYCRIWLLNELCGKMEWVVKSNINIVEEIPLCHFANDEYNEPWTVAHHDKEAPLTQDELDEWDFDDGIILKTTDNKSDEPCWSYAIVFLGFHPYKEIIFFCISSTALSYHLNTSKVQVLGSLHITEMERSFPYTACWELFENNR
ncbi:unnamed protein product [Urochloa humidicola]